MPYPNDNVKTVDLSPSFASFGERPVFLIPFTPVVPPPPTPVAPVVEIDPEPADGPIEPNQTFTVTVLFNEAPTEVVLEVREAPDEPSLDESLGRVVYGTGEGFRGGFQSSALSITMLGQLYTFTVVTDNPWAPGALRFSVFASDSTGGSTV
jgi:hypothetical protein